MNELNRFWRKRDRRIIIEKKKMKFSFHQFSPVGKCGLKGRAYNFENNRE